MKLEIVFLEIFVSKARGISTFFRLSHYEAKLIHPGLRHVVRVHPLWQQRDKAGYYPYSSIPPYWRAHVADYNPIVLEIIARALPR